METVAGEWAKVVATVAALAATFIGTPSKGADGPAREPWTIVPPLFMMENDSFFHGTDRHYTSGLYASATSGAKDQCWCDALADAVMPAKAEEPVKYRYGVFAGQNMFTPENLSISVPDPRDRPYGGWLFAGARLYRESDSVLDRAQATIGVAGPGSGADAVQTWWHALHWFGGVPPLGWHAQIKDEPGLVLSEQRMWRKSLSTGLIETEILPEVNASAGNIFTYAGIGATLRIGQGLRANWGAPRIEPSLQGADFVNFNVAGAFAWNVYIGAEGRAVLRNIFLDGNSLQHSPSVDKRALVADVNVGAEMFFFERVSVHASYTIRTHEFEGQDTNDRFFSFALSYSY